MITQRYLWIPVLCFFAITGQVSAQSNAGSNVEKLEETVRVLERRVAALEGQLRQRSATTLVSADKASWRKLQRGLPEAEVEKLLGSPSKVDAFGSFTVWHFGYPSGGRVQFDGGSRTVSGWQEP